MKWPRLRWRGRFSPEQLFSAHFSEPLDQEWVNGLIGRATLLLALLSVGCAMPRFPGLSSLEDSLLYQPTRYPKIEPQPPELLKEDVWFTAKDGTKLNGWYCPVEHPRAVVLFAHGNAGNVADRWPTFRLFTARLGVTIMGFDYRGYGRSEGKPSEEGLLADARAARKFLAEKAGVKESDIVLYGQSLGGAVMVDLATNDGARGLILQSTFTSLADVANYKFPLTPPGNALQNRFDSLSKIGKYHGRLVIAHGTDDDLVPISQAKTLYAAANEPKVFVAAVEAGHNFSPSLEYLITLDDFFNRL
jgi:fermentation-respiration switch protein FrsA (DUF1100 family)